MPANTFVATIEAIVEVGATPVFVDVDDDTLLVTAAHIEAAITPSTAAAIVVHLYGQMPDMDAISAVTAKAGIALIEDAAQAQGARWRDRRAGSFGHAGGVQLLPGQEPRCVRRRRRHHHQRRRADSQDPLVRRPRPPGRHQARARVLRAQQPPRRAPGRDPLDQAQAPRHVERLPPGRLRPLPHAPRRHELPGARRRSPARRRCTTSRSFGCQTAPAVTSALDAHGIGWGLHYPIPCHHQHPFTRFAHGPYIVTEQAADEIVSVPMFPTITRREVERVCEILVAATQGSASGTGS